jgi:hypothetical protein
VKGLAAREAFHTNLPEENLHYYGDGVFPRQFHCCGNNTEYGRAEFLFSLASYCLLLTPRTTNWKASAADDYSGAECIIFRGSVPRQNRTGEPERLDSTMLWANFQANSDSDSRSP